jgi:hypothetical protein
MSATQSSGNELKKTDTSKKIDALLELAKQRQKELEKLKEKQIILLKQL